MLPALELHKRKIRRIATIFCASFLFVAFSTTVHAAAKSLESSQFISPLSPDQPQSQETTAEAENPASLIPQAQAETANECELSDIFAPEVLRWRDKICQWSKEHQLHPNLIATVMQIESCGSHLAVSATGVRGLFQVTGANLDGLDPFDPNVSMAKGPGKVLKSELAAARGNVIAAMAGYNGGAYARKYMAGEISHNQFYWFLRNHTSGLWRSHKEASAKINEVEYYAQWANIFQEAGREDSSTLDRWYAKGGDRLCRQSSQTDISSVLEK